MTIGCLGPQGTFSEQAAIAYYKLSGAADTSIHYSATIEDAIFAVQNGELDKAVVPIENSIEGAVNAAVDTLIFDTELFIELQIILPISQNMFTSQDTTQIDTIMSHPQAIPQCRQFLRSHYPNAVLLPVESTAEAARRVSLGEKNTAAIGNTLAADLYGLKILHRDIQEDKTNATTFAVLTRADTSAPKTEHQTSVAFSTKNKPGELYKLLDIFALWDLNLTKIQSRPRKKFPGEYIFFIDIASGADTEDINDALKMITRKTNFFKNLGSYRVFNAF